MDGRKGRHWTWERWERAPGARGRNGNYATASIIAGMVFFALLGVAIVMRAVSPTPQDLDESPLAYARRAAAREAFQGAYMADCEQLALAAIKEPFKTFAAKTGLYEPAAFAPALACLDVHLAAAGAPTLDEQLKGPNGLGAFMELDCSGELRSTDPCERAFLFSKSKSAKIGQAIAARLNEKGAKQ